MTYWILGKYNNKSFGSKADILNAIAKQKFQTSPGFVIWCNFIPEIIDTIYDKYVGSSNYIVRSSSNFEDSNNLSYAWIFLSVSGIYSKKTLIEDIDRVFKSMDSKLIDAYELGVLWKINKNRKMNVIIQEYIEWEFSWVYFSKLDNKEILNYVLWWNSLLIEWVEDWSILHFDVNKNIIFEEYNIQKYITNISSKIEYHDVFKLSFDIVMYIIGELRRIRNIFQWEVDIEWTFKDNILYILQVRPITT